MAHSRGFAPALEHSHGSKEKQGDGAYGQDLQPHHDSS